MTVAVLVERDGAIATVVLDRPDKLNALSLASWTELGARMRELSADDDVRCVIVRGAGGKAFAAGADIATVGCRHSPIARIVAWIVSP